MFYFFKAHSWCHGGSASPSWGTSSGENFDQSHWGFPMFPVDRESQISFDGKICGKNFGKESSFWFLKCLNIRSFQLLLWNKSLLFVGYQPRLRPKVMRLLVVWKSPFLCRVFFCQSSVPSCCPKLQRRKPEIQCAPLSDMSMPICQQKRDCHIDLSSDRVTWLFKLYIGDYYATQYY